MTVKDIVDENFQDYKKPCMFICTVKCDGKCWRELGLPSSTCQNEEIQKQPSLFVDNDEIVSRYIKNKITSAICIAGLEPFLQFGELLSLIAAFREKTMDDIVIYTGYNKRELRAQIEVLREFPNIIIKYGRYRPDLPSRFDEVLGVTLASNNQYAEKIS